MAQNMFKNAAEPYAPSPMSFTTVPDLISCHYDEDTDPSPTPPEPYQYLDGYQYNAYPINVPTSCAGYMTPQPTIVNSIEFTDLTQMQHEERLRGQRRSTTTQDKEAASNMRIRRRAQNRASQRAFRERKEKHVQNLEHQLQELESKHRQLSQSYSDLDSNHRELKAEADMLRQQLDSVKQSGHSAAASASSPTSRESSVEWGLTPGTTEPVKQETEQDAFYDPFCGSHGSLIVGDHHATPEAFFASTNRGGGATHDWGF